MDIYQAAHLYTTQFHGYGLKNGVPTPEMDADAMQAVVKLAAQSDMPADVKLKHLDEIVGITALVAPQSATIFNRRIVDNPEQREFAKSLETALAIMEERSPETWQHIKNHTALTMLYYEKQLGPANAANPPNEKELLTLFTGALGHDIGKLGLDPELLHKDTRVAPKAFAEALNNYRRSVSNYPEKLHDTIFLEEANMGRILFAEPGSTPLAPITNATMPDLGKDMRRSETYWVGDADRQKYSQIWNRINAYAKASIPPGGWLNEAEQKALTMPQRGTVTPDEMRVIESHDAMSEAFFRATPLPPDLSGVRDIVSMDRFRRNDSHPGGDSLLANVIHTTDVFEAITGNRSYRKPYTLEEAVKVMDGMAKDGRINAATLQSLKDSGALDTYAVAAGLQHSTDLQQSGQRPYQPFSPEQTWVQKVGRTQPQTWKDGVAISNRQTITLRA